MTKWTTPSFGCWLCWLCLAAGCASATGRAPTPQVYEPSRDHVAASVQVEIHASPGVVYDYVVREDTPQRDLRAFGLVPGVRGGVRLTDGGWDHVDARRVVLEAAVATQFRPYMRRGLDAIRARIEAGGT